MANLIQQSSIYPPVDLNSFTVPPLPKTVDNRGYLYLVLDRAFPLHFKVGRTIDAKKRLAAYNADRPYPTVTYIIITELLPDAKAAEKALIQAMYEKSPPTTNSFEWFELRFKNLATELIQRIETLALEAEPI